MTDNEIKIKSEVKSENDSEVDYDDELDEDFEDDTKNKLSTKELEETTSSFENPVGLEDSDKSFLANGPQLSKADINKLRKKMSGMSKDQISTMISKMMNINDFGLGKDTDNLNAVSVNQLDDKRRMRTSFKK